SGQNSQPDPRFSDHAVPCRPTWGGAMPAERAEVQVRPGGEEDLAALTDLYNHYVRETAITFDTSPFTPEERRPWLLSHPVDGPHRLLVATGAGAGRILGYATSRAYRTRPAYATSVETTVYV